MDDDMHHQRVMLCWRHAGCILMLTIWIQNIIVDLIILKKHPRLIQKINRLSEPKFIYPYTLVKERFKYWEKDFADIKNEFISLFSPPPQLRELIESVCIIRNALSHSYLSAGKDYLIYRPNGRKKNLTFKKHFEINKKNDQIYAGKNCYTIRLADKKNFDKLFNYINQLDIKYLREETKRLGIIYARIR